MNIDNGLTRGVFCYELKNRFRCSVKVTDEYHICYVASSSRLSNFIELTNKEVLLLPAGKAASSTDYTLFAVRYKNAYILLDLSLVNAVLEEQITRRCFSFLGERKQLRREKLIEGYKADLYIEDTGTVIEIKTVLSTAKEAEFPTVYSERTIRQLKKIKSLLEKGLSCCLLFISLSPTVCSINLNYDPEFLELFKLCVDKGLIYKALRLKTTERSITVDRSVEVVL